MATRDRTRPRRDQTRDQLIDAAAVVFDERGFDGASLEQIADHAGLTKGAIYSSFRGKDDLFQAVVSRQIEDRLAQITTAVSAGDPGGGDAPAAMRRIGTVLTAATASQPSWHVAFIEYWVRAVRHPQVNAAFVASRRTAREAIVLAIREQQRHWGVELVVTPERLAVVILALSNGLAIEATAGDVDDQLFADVLQRLIRPADMP